MPSASPSPSEATGARHRARNTRRFVRQPVQNLAYITIEQSNGGIMRDLGEGGCAVRLMAALEANRMLPLRFDLPSPRTRVEAVARVAWSESSGQAGLEFIGLSADARLRVKDWIFTQLLAAAHQASGANSIFIHKRLGEEATELLFSGAARVPIVLAQDPAPAAEPPSPPRAVASNAGGWFSLSARTLAGLVDSLILLSAVLLFGVVAIAMTNLFPTWLLASALAVGATALFGAVYWFFFVLWIGKTPGETLARMACRDSGHPLEEELPRFR